MPSPRLLLPGLLALACLAAPAAARPAGEIVAEARALLDASRLPEAREPLEALLAREPRHLEAALLLATVYDGLRRRDDALRLLEPFLKRHPEEHRLLGLYAGQCLLRAAELGSGLRALRLSRRGAETMERAVGLAPDEIPYREALAEFYGQAPAVAGGGVDKALRHADSIAQRDPVRGAAWQASLLLRAGRPEDALAACDRALAARPDAYLALFTLGRTVAETGLRLEDGEAALRRCVEAPPAPEQPGRASAWFYLGRIAERRGEIAAARAAYERALALEPHFARPAEALRRLPGPR